MLVLSQRIDERIVIGSTVTVTVLEVRGDRVKLGISAPNEMPVHRQEVQCRIERECGNEPSHEIKKVSARARSSTSDQPADDLAQDQE